MQMCKFTKFSAAVILLLCLQLHATQCRRITGGGGRRPPSYSPAVHHQPAVHYQPAVHHQPPVHHPPSHGSGSGTVRPLGFDPAAPPPKLNNPPQGTGGNRPIGFVDPHQSAHPVGSPPHVQGTGTVRPLGFDPSGHSPGHHPVGPPKQNSPLGNAPPHPPAGYHGPSPPPYNPHYNNAGGFGQPPAYNPAGHPQTHNPAGYGPPPAYNQGNYNPQGGYHPQGGYQPGYHPQGGYQPGYHPQGGGGGVTIINNNVNNHHGGYGGYGGYAGYSPPVYTTHDTGSTALGFFLGYSLAKISTPSYHYHGNYYDSGSGPRYDHYTVHHYYHNKENLPKEATIEPNAIVACVGDSGSFCPANTTSLCTNNGAVMCVASAVSTVPCAKEKQTNCVKSTVPCKDNNAPECKQSAQNSATIAIPCISTAKIYGDISYVNNSIVISNSTDGNATTNSNATTTEVTTIVTTTESNTNITTTTAAPVNAAANKTDVPQGPAQSFCVTILALPAERKLTEGEKLFKSSKVTFATFAVNTLGIE